VLVAGFLLINVLIGIVINAMEAARREDRAAMRAEQQELAELVQALRDTVDDLDDRLNGSDQVASAARRRS
jgi:cell division protein FtsB